MQVHYNIQSFPRAVPGFFLHSNTFFFLSVWGETKGSQTLILEFSGHSDRKHARLLHKFPSMGSVTVCTLVRFDPNSSGISTIFSYSIKSYINQFLLRAKLVPGKLVQLALQVHGNNGPYIEAFNHDDSWHSVCVSWTQNGGHWALFANGREGFRGEGLNSSEGIGRDGIFIIGQELDTFGGSFKKNGSFSGSITELHIWDRVLDRAEIYTMEKQCSPISSGLVFNWSGATMETETSLTKLRSDNPCQGTFVRMQHEAGEAAEGLPKSKSNFFNHQV